MSDGFDRIINKIDNLEASSQGYIVELAIASRAAAEQALNMKLGAKAKHFKVSVESTGATIAVTVEPIDDAGRFIYYGTAPHQIVAKSGNAMPIGGGNFSMKVNNPGTNGMKDEIDEVVLAAVIAAKRLIGGFGGRI